MDIKEKKLFNSPFIGKSAVLIYISMLIFIVGFGYYIIPYVIFVIAFLLIILNFDNLKLYNWFVKRPLTQKLLLLFLLALFLRFLMLILDQVITRDIEMYVSRSSSMMSGEIPYQDFTVKKPPLYAYMLQMLGESIGTGMLQFRAFFSILDAAIPVLIFSLGMIKYDETFSIKAGLIYSICPLPIIAVGLSGHYEPLVMICVLVSLILLFKNKYPASAFLLGLGFALKFFPIVLLPFFAWKITKWKDRTLYIMIFTVPFILSMIPILFMNPGAFGSYMVEQSYTWSAKKSFAFAYEVIIGTKLLLGIKFSLLITSLFMLMILAMFITWLKKKFNVTFWFRIIIILFLIYYGLFVISYMKYYHSQLGIADPLPPMAFFSLIYFPLIFFILTKYWQHFTVKIEKREEIFILGAFSLIFLQFSSSQYNPWYILWFLPFILAINNYKIKMVLLWLIFWSFEGGIGIPLLPGFSLS